MAFDFGMISRAFSNIVRRSQDPKLADSDRPGPISSDLPFALDAPGSQERYVDRVDPLTSPFYADSEGTDTSNLAAAKDNPAAGGDSAFDLGIPRMNATPREPTHEVHPSEHDDSEASFLPPNSRYNHAEAVPNADEIPPKNGAKNDPIEQPASSLTTPNTFVERRVFISDRRRESTKKRHPIGHFVIIGLEIAAVFGLMLGLAVAGLAWRLSKGPINLAQYSSQIQDALNQAAGPNTIEVSRLQLAWSPTRRRFELEARDVDVFSPKHDRLARFDTINLSLRAAPLLVGKVSFASAFARGGLVSVVRWPDGRLSAGLGAPAQIAPPQQAPVSSGNWEKKVFAAMDQIAKSLASTDPASFSIENAEFCFLDQGTQRELVFSGAKIALSLRNQRLETELTLPVGTGDVRVSATSEPNGPITFDAKFAGASLSAMGGNWISQVLRAHRGEMDHTGLLGNISVRLDRKAGLIAGNLSLDLLENGQVRPANAAATGTGTRTGPQPATKSSNAKAASQPVIARLAANYDRPRDTLDFSKLQLGYGRSRLEGTLAIQEFGSSLHDPKRHDIAFALDLRRPRLDLGNAFEKELGVKHLSAQGKVDFGARKVSFRNIVAEAQNGTALGDAAFGWVTLPDGRSNFFVDAQAKTIGSLGVSEILPFWPVVLGVDAREWVATNIHAGRLSNVVAKIDIRADRTKPEGLPNEAIDVRFDFEGAVVTIVEGAPQATQGKGRAQLFGDSFFLDLSSGDFNGLAAKNVKVEIPYFTPKGRPAYFTGSLSGDLSRVIDGLSQSDERLAGSLPIPADGFHGAGTIRFDVSRPTLRDVPIENFAIDVSGSFTDASLTVNNGQWAFTNGVARFTADNKQVLIHADFAGDVSPLSIEASLPYEEDAPASAALHGRVTPALFASLGIPVRASLSGVMAFDANFAGHGFGLNRGNARFDLVNSRVDFPGIWTKAAGIPASLALDLVRRPGGSFDLRGFDAQGPDLIAKGAATFAADGRIVSASLERLKLGSALDLAANITRSDDGQLLRMQVRGGQLDVSPIVQRFLAASANGSPANNDNAQKTAIGSSTETNPAQPTRTGFELDGELGTLTISPGLVLHQVAIASRSVGAQLLTARLNGKTSGGAAMSFEVAPDPQPDMRVVRVDVADLGAALSPFLSNGEITGGRAMINGQWALSPQGVSRFAFKADDLRLAQAPAIAQVLSLASLRGISDVLNGEGIAFKEASGIVKVRQSRVALEDVRASGPAFGFTAHGGLDFATRNLDIEGVLVPSYGANAAIGAIPGLGKIFVSRKGEGIVGVNYAVRGTFDKARASVNPLSALAPGIFRRIFDPVRKIPDWTAQPIQGSTPALPAPN